MRARSRSSDNASACDLSWCGAAGRDKHPNKGRFTALPQEVSFPTTRDLHVSGDIKHPAGPRFSSRRGTNIPILAKFMNHELCASVEIFYFYKPNFRNDFSPSVILY